MGEDFASWREKFNQNRMKSWRQAPAQAG